MGNRGSYSSSATMEKISWAEGVVKNAKPSTRGKTDVRPCGICRRRVVEHETLSASSCNALRNNRIFKLSTNASRAGSSLKF